MADIQQYVPLELVDRDPQDLVDLALQHLQAKLPEFEAREGQTELVLLEAIALEVAESVFAINRLPDTMTEVLLSFFNIVRDPGQQPIADIEFQTSGGQGAVIPAGSRFVLDTGSGLEPLVLTTNQELVIPPGANSGVMAATGEQFTDNYNSVPAGTLLAPSETLIYVDYARLATSVNDGRDPETDQEYLTRGVKRMQRLSTTLSVPSQFQAAAEEYVYVSKAMAVDAYNPDLDPDQNGPTGNDVGYVTVAVYGDGELVSTEHKDEILSDLEEQSSANLFVKVIDPVITTVDVTATIALDPDVNTADVVESVNSTLAATLTPENWPWGTVVRRSQLISLITNIEGVDYVDELTLPAADVTLPAVANLIQLGTATINVTV